MTEQPKPKPVIFVATPMYGGQCFGAYTHSILQLSHAFAQLGWTWTPAFIFNESLITRARDDLAAKFLESPATHLLFIDADIQFNAQHVVDMILADKPVIGGVYPLKAINWQRAYDASKAGAKVQDLPLIASEYVLNTVDPKAAVALGSKIPIEVQRIGTGMMLIKREVFEKLIPKVPKYFANNKDNMGKAINQFFDTSIDQETKHLLSEDFHFCKLCRNNDIQLWAAPWCVGGHIGTYWFGMRT